MQREFIGTVKCRDFEVRYYLLAEFSELGRLYGVGMERDGEGVDLPAITPSRMRAQALLKDLMWGQVTPVSLRDVVEDWLLS